MIEKLIKTDEVDDIIIKRRDDFQYSLYASKGDQYWLIANISLAKMPYISKTSVIFEFSERNGDDVNI